MPNSNPFLSDGSSSGSKAAPNASPKLQKLTDVAGQLANKTGPLSKQEQAIVTANKGLQKFQHGSGVGGFLQNAADDATGTISNAPRALPGLAAAAYKTGKSTIEDTDWSDPTSFLKLVGSPIVVPFEAASAVLNATGHKTPKLLQATGGQQNAVRSLVGGFKGNVSKSDAARYPLVAQQGQSFRNTYNRLSDPGKLVHDYAQHPFSSLAEDAANASVVAAPLAGPLAKAADAAGFAKTAAALGAGPELLNKAAQGPFLPTSMAARGLNKGLGVISEKLAASEGAQKALSHVGLDEAARARRATYHGAQTDIAATGPAAVKLNKPQQDLLPSKAEQEAFHLVAQGEAPAFAAARAVPEHATPPALSELETRQQALRGKTVTPAGSFDDLVKNYGKGTLSSEGAHLAADVVEGKNPELATRIQQAQEIHHQGLTTGREATYLAGDQSRQAQVETKPLPMVVKPFEKTAQRAQTAAGNDRFLADQAQRAAELHPQDMNLRNAADVANQRAVRSESAARSAQRELSTKQQSIEAMPARLRPAATAGRAAQDFINAHAVELEKLGDHEGAAALRSQAAGVNTTLDQFAAAGINPDHFIHPAGREPSPGGLFRKSLKGKSANTLTGQEISRSESANPVYDRSIPAQARAEAGRAAGIIKQQTAEAIGSSKFAGRLSDLRDTEGHQLFQTQGDAARGGYVPLDIGPTGQVNAQTVFVPKAIKEQFDTQLGPRQVGKLLGAYDKTTRAFKTSVLALSPAWQVHRTIGHAIMAMAGGGVDPATLVKNFATVIKEHRDTGEWHGPQELRGTGPNADAMSFQNPRLPGEVGKIRAAASAIPRASYRVSSFMDTAMRSAVYLAKEQAGHSPELALRESLRAMGDFTKMNPVEQQFVKRVIPFYAWQKHITKLAFTLPIEHPLRTAWMAKLSNEYGQPQDWMRALPDYLQSAINIGGGNFLAPGHTFPFPVNPAENFTPKGLAYSLNPILKAALGKVTGFNADTGTTYTGRPGSGGSTIFGKETAPVPGLLQQLRTLTPQGRLLDTLTGRNDVARYNTGETVLTTDPKTGKRVPIKTPQSLSQSLLKFGGADIRKEKDLVGIANSRLSNRLKSAKAKEDYTRQRKVSGGSSNPFLK